MIRIYAGKELEKVLHKFSLPESFLEGLDFIVVSSDESKNKFALQTALEITDGYVEEVIVDGKTFFLCYKNG